MSSLINFLARLAGLERRVEVLAELLARLERENLRLTQELERLGRRQP